MFAPPRNMAAEGLKMHLATARQHVSQQATPLIIVVETVPDLGDTLVQLCDFLRIRVVRVAAGAALARELLIERPICVLAESPLAGPEICDALAAIAQHDPTLPVLVVGSSPTADEGEPVALSNLTWVARRPGLRMLVEFLFMAERNGDIGGLMPI
jgi:hypothetical protein